MSDGENPGTLSRPHTTIGAQNLLNLQNPRHTGFLRKRGKRDRILERFKFLSGVLRWRQRFVIISKGCVYCYGSEAARSPIQCFSLQGYNRMIKMETEQTPWAFRLTAPGDTMKIHFFSCYSDEQRRTWMKAMRAEMLAANNMQDDSGSAGSFKDVYVYLQTPVFEALPEQKEGDNEDSDNDSDYDRIPDEAIVDARTRRKTMPLPAVPKDEYTDVNKTNSVGAALKPPKTPTKPDKGHDYINGPGKKPVTKPKPNAKPSKSPKLTEDQYFFPDKDRDKALEALRSKKGEGTYLVRKSRTGENKVLAVIAEDDIKEYRIITKENKFTVNNKDYFKSVEDLLHHHEKAPLPGRSTTLGRAYSAMDLTF